MTQRSKGVGGDLGEVRLPRLRLFQIGEAFVAGVSRDELGVEPVEVLPLLR